MKLIFLILGITGICVLVNGCYYDKADQLYPGGNSCNLVSPTFSGDVLPLIKARCATAGCHNAGSSNGPGELLTYTEIKSAASQIKSAVLSGEMPQGSTLTQTEIQSISCWIDAGAPDN